MTQADLLQKAIHCFRTQNEFIRAVDPQLSPAVVSQWRNLGIPESRYAQIERATGGKVKARQLHDAAFDLIQFK